MNFLENINVVSDEEYERLIAEEEKKERIQRAKLFDQYIPSGLADTDLERLHKDTVDQSKAWAKEKNRMLNLYIHGITGVGKSRLGWLALKRLFVLHKTNWHAIGAEAWSRRIVSEQTLMEELINVPALLFDDLGKERDTPTAEAGIFELIRERMDRRKTTIYTSNYSIDHLVERFKKRETGTAIERRLVESSLCLEML